MKDQGYWLPWLCFWLVGLFLGVGIGLNVLDKTDHVDPCEDAIFQRTLSFKLNDWEIRARKKLGEQWSCYEIGQTERFTLYGEFGQTLKVRIVFVLKKKEEAMK